MYDFFFVGSCIDIIIIIYIFCLLIKTLHKLFLV